MSDSPPSKTRIILVVGTTFGLSFLAFAGAMHLCDLWGVNPWLRDWLAGGAGIATLLLIARGFGAGRRP